MHLTAHRRITGGHETSAGRLTPLFPDRFVGRGLRTAVQTEAHQRRRGTVMTAVYVSPSSFPVSVSKAGVEWPDPLAPGHSATGIPRALDRNRRKQTESILIIWQQFPSEMPHTY